MKLDEAASIALAEWSEERIAEIVNVCASDPKITTEIQKLHDGELAGKLMTSMAVLEAIRMECERRGL